MCVQNNMCVKEVEGKERERERERERKERKANRTR